MNFLDLRSVPVMDNDGVAECGTDPDKLVELAVKKCAPDIPSGLPTAARVFCLRDGGIWAVTLPYAANIDPEVAKRAIKNALKHRRAAAAIFIGVALGRIDRKASVIFYAENRRGKARARVLTPLKGEGDSIRGWTESLGKVDAKANRPFAFFGKE